MSVADMETGQGLFVNELVCGYIGLQDVYDNLNKPEKL